MGSDLHLNCQVETRKVLWLIGLILASVLIVQYFELPYGSFLSSGKAFFNSSDDVRDKGLEVSNHSDELKTTERSIGLAPQSDIISPSISYMSETEILASPPSLAFLPAPDEAISPSVSPSQWENGTTFLARTSPPPPKEMGNNSNSSVVTIFEMNDMLQSSLFSPSTKSPLWPSVADQELLDAKSLIENAAIVEHHPKLYAPIYRNLTAFVRSYEIMEQKLKVYIYEDGKRPVFHQPRLKGIYASEGWFMKLLKASNRFLTKKPEEAHLFYLPFSSQLLAEYVYVPDSHTFHDITRYLKNYLDAIKARYPFWNRTDGADHFVVACHDWAPVETRHLMSNCIRALCNADVKEGFQFGKDVSLPETFIHSPQNPMRDIGGRPPSERTTLAFFAGQMHGYLRPILLKYWENKDPDMKIYGRMRKGYSWHMKTSRYCICAKGYEVNSPRVVEAIIYGCVPVIISDNFVPPFFDVLKWESFAVFVLEKDIPELKRILGSISEKRYLVMQHRVRQVRQHFLWHNKPVKYDIFHMILQSVWYKRLPRLPQR